MNHPIAAAATTLPPPTIHHPVATTATVPQPQPQIIYVQTSGHTTSEVTQRQVGKAVKYGRFSLTRIMIAFCTIGISIPFIGLRKKRSVVKYS